MRWLLAHNSAGSGADEDADADDQVAGLAPATTARFAKFRDGLQACVKQLAGLLTKMHMGHFSPMIFLSDLVNPKLVKVIKGADAQSFMI